MDRIVIVDEQDNVLGEKKREEITSSDIYRVSALWITNARGGILLAKRALSKKHDPGKWGPAVAGTVEAGESYLENIIKEAREELGLDNIKPTIGPKVKIVGEHSFFGQWFALSVDEEQKFVVQPEEVAEIRWFSPTELRKHLDDSPEDFIRSSAYWPINLKF